jgi:hypothetical protein
MYITATAYTIIAPEILHRCTPKHCWGFPSFASSKNTAEEKPTSLLQIPFLYVCINTSCQLTCMSYSISESQQIYT